MLKPVFPMSVFNETKSETFCVKFLSFLFLDILATDCDSTHSCTTQEKCFMYDTTIEQLVVNDLNEDSNPVVLVVDCSYANGQITTPDNKTYNTSSPECTSRPEFYNKPNGSFCEFTATPTTTLSKLFFL